MSEPWYTVVLLRVDASELQPHVQCVQAPNRAVAVERAIEAGQKEIAGWEEDEDLSPDDVDFDIYDIRVLFNGDTEPKWDWG